MGVLYEALELCKLHGLEEYVVNVLGSGQTIIKEVETISSKSSNEERKREMESLYVSL